MRGPLARQHYTNSVLRIFKEMNPNLLDKSFPKFPKQSPPTNTHTRPPPPNQSDRQYLGQGHGMRKPASYNQRYVDNRQGNRGHTKQANNHFQRKGRARMSHPETGFTIPTENRFNTFYNNQGNY